MAGMYQLAWITSSRSNSGSQSSIPFYSNVFCMSRGLPKRFQMQLPPCLLNFKQRFRISRMASSEGTSRIVQWSFIMFIMRILLAFLVNRPMMFLESFHHLTSLSESTCRQVPAGQQNSRLPVRGSTRTLGSRLLESNQQVISVPAAWMRGVTRTLEMFSWMMRVRLQTSPKRMTQQSFAILWLPTSSSVQQRCLSPWTGRNCFRLSFEGPLMRSYTNSQSLLNIQSNMKINSTSKIIPNFFAPHLDDYADFQPQPVASPFRPIQNVLEKSACKSNRKSRIPKAFLDDQSQEEAQTQLPPSSKDKARGAPQCQEQQQSLSGFLNVVKQSEMLLSTGIKESSEQNSEEKGGQIVDGDCEEIVSLPAVKDIDKLRKVWSSNSEESDKQSSKKDERKADKIQQKQEILQISSVSLFQTIKNGTRKCLLRRDKNSPSGFIQYNLYLQGSLQHILTVRKQGVWLYCIYLRQRCVGSDFFAFTPIAKLESNFLGNKYTLIKHKEKYSSATICYETNILGLSGPRKFFAYLPRTPLPYEYLNDCYESGKHRDKIEKCVSKTARWNEKVQSYVLNFHGRATESSIKNFVVTDPEEREESNFIIFGKVGPDVYNLDIQSPFSLVQGLAVALTAFQRKLTCD